VSGLRDIATKHRHGHEPGFHWRGREVSRLEGLSDAVFAFAITLLVISLEVPSDVHEMVASMRGFVPFVFSFFVLYRLWVTQYRFFRRYGLEDATTIRLNGVLLFMVLFFVYPLKFLTSRIAEWVMSGERMRPTHAASLLADPDVRALVLYYFLGVAAVFITLGLMYRHAYRRRHALQLTPHEVHRTQESYRRLFLSAAMGAIGPIAVLNLGGPHATLALILQYAIVLGLVVGIVLLRRARRGAPAMDDEYVAPVAGR
jgi:uncharacterized membrane protein